MSSMDAQFAFPLVQVPNAFRAPCAPSTWSSPPFCPSGSTGSNPTTHYTPPSQVPSTQRAFYPPGHHAQTPWSPCRTSPPRLPSSSFDDTSLVFDPALEPESPRRSGLDASFVEMVANGFTFGDRDQEFRAATLGVLYEIMRELRDRAESLQRFETTLMDVSARLGDTFYLTSEWKTNIRLIAGEVIFEPKRVSYMHIHLDVEARIRKNQKDLRFICCNVSHQKSLMSAIKHACSSVRDEYCELIRNSVSDDDSSHSTLNDFVYEVTNRFHPSNSTRLVNAHTIQHVAILCRFALENPDLGVGEADEDGDDDYVLLPGGSTGPNTEAGDGDAATDLLRPVSAASTATNNGSREEKRKCGTNRQKCDDFWSMVEEWFATHLTSEQSWDSPGWKMYIKETVDNDHMRFRRRTVEHPYFADF
ncbi:hypothetical protein EDB85DRAFT_2137235 [Lactarius pseudohatsudake]|nr:hypothetical protein EDB85DRAFT_2137235 [Lactarius pseudohatsudake]